MDMNVVFTITDNYTAYCGVALCSLLENNKDVTVNVYIISDFIKNKFKNYIISF